MAKNLFKALVFFLLAVIGGVFAELVIWPYLLTKPLFNRYQIFRPSVYLTQTQQVIVQENTALQDAVSKVANTVIGVKTKSGTNSFISGSGLIVTNDGLVITLSSLIPQGKTFYFYIDNKSQEYQVLRRDSQTNLVLVKLGASGLATAGFADFADLKLGERVFLVKAGETQQTVNEGIISSLLENEIATNIFETSQANGSPLFDISGNIVGLVQVSANGQVKAVPSSKIRSFLGF